ncbi:MAG TPA: hypothetical protein G4O00_13450 [Thermoflexia bacterium]|jgi:hypothetical protein|nr:hypothetical protein [Thermoflexia bacterium]
MSEIAPEPVGRFDEPDENEKKTNVWLIVAIVAIALIVLCCCCAGLATLAYLASEGELGLLLPSLLAL